MKEIPLFPLPGVVLFPGEVIPLHIFEPRYRKMLEDITSSDSRFGLINAANSKLCTVGCIAEVIRSEKLEDGRSNIIAVGVERFTLVKETETQDYPRGIVKTFRENAKPADVAPYATKASDLMRELVQLMVTLKKGTPVEIGDIPKDPKHLSFWIASTLSDLPVLKQSLLEMKDTDLRLKTEIPILNDLRNQLRALVAIEDAFADTPTDLE